MAKYHVKRTCGHYEDVDLVGPSTDRERRIAWLERSGVCSECYRARQSAAIAERSAERKLPTLTGSEKQIAWANTIRDRLIRAVEGFGAELDRQVEIRNHQEQWLTDEERAEVHAIRERIALTLVWLASQTEARWWIDRRSWDERRAIQEMTPESKAGERSA